MLVSRLYNYSGAICTFVFCAVSLWGLVPAPAHAQAHAQTDTSCPHAAFNITGVEVSSVADNATTARRLATSGGAVQAWEILKARVLLAGEDFDRKGNGDAIVIDDLIDHRRIVNETVLARRYSGTFDYCFDAEKLRAVFRARGVRHAELVSAPVLVLPIWNGPRGARLKGSPGHWYAAWQGLMAAHHGLVDLRLPEGLSTDRAINPDAVVAGDADAIAAAAAFTGTQKVMVAVATPQAATPGNITVTITAALYGMDGMVESAFFESAPAAFSESGAARILTRLARDAVMRLEGDWRDANAATTGDSSAGVILLTIPARDIKTWHGQVAVLRDMPAVRELRVVQISSEGGVVRLDLSASVESLVTALEQQGLTIEAGRHEDGGIVLELLPRRAQG